VLEFNGEGNHVHALIEYPPKLSISQIVNALKGVSSRRYGQAGHKKPHKEALWSPSYFAVSVGDAPLEALKEYIRNQEKPATEEGACIPISWSELAYACPIATKIRNSCSTFDDRSECIFVSRIVTYGRCVDISFIENPAQCQ
jgi:putative transposase